MGQDGKAEGKAEDSGEASSPMSKMKEGGGSSSIKCPMLNSCNYTVWSMRMKVLLKVHKVWEIMESGEKVGELDSAKDVWEAIKARHLGADRVKEARLQTLMAEFDRLRMKDSEKVDDFVGRLSEITSKSAALGVETEESKVVKKFLSSLPRRKYIHIVASLEQVLDLNNTSFEDIIGRIKAYEERVADEEDTQEEQGKLMLANADS